MATAADRLALLLPQLKAGKGADAACALIAESAVSLQHLRERKVIPKLCSLACDKVRCQAPTGMPVTLTTSGGRPALSSPLSWAPAPWHPLFQMHGHRRRHRRHCRCSCCRTQQSARRRCRCSLWPPPMARRARATWARRLARCWRPWQALPSMRHPHLQRHSSMRQPPRTAMPPCNSMLRCCCGGLPTTTRPPREAHSLQHLVPGAYSQRRLSARPCTLRRPRARRFSS